MMLYIRRRTVSLRQSVLVFILLYDFRDRASPHLTFKSFRRSGSAVLVRVKFQGQFAVGFLQVLLAGVPLHPQNFVVVSTPLYPGSARKVTFTGLSPQTPPQPAPPDPPPPAAALAAPSAAPLPRPLSRSGVAPAPRSPPHAVQLLRRVGHGGRGGPRGSPPSAPLTTRRPGPPAPPCCARKRLPRGGLWVRESAARPAPPWRRADYNTQRAPRGSGA